MKSLTMWKEIVTLTGVVLMLLFVNAAAADKRTGRGEAMNEQQATVSVAVFGATGTVGDGILKAVMADPRVARILVVTRRESQRIAAGRESGRLDVVMHLDYLDYSKLSGELTGIDAVYWALGTSSRNVDKAQYGVIHVDFPVAFLQAWLAAEEGSAKSFHLVSGAGTSADSWFHWAREKARAESALAELADGTPILPLAYRPSFVFPTEERLGGLQRMFRVVLLAINSGVDASTIGCAMLNNSLAPPDVPMIYENGEILALGCAEG